MLSIEKNESVNIFNIVGTLNELDIREGTSQKSGDTYVSCNAQIKVMQEIDGKMTENIHSVSLFSMRHKKDGSENKNFDRIKEYGEKLIALSATEDESQASKVYVQASAAENMFVGSNGSVVEKAYRLSTNFINSQRASDVEGATFEITGALVSKNPEVDKEGNETGRLILSICLVGWGGKANVLEFIATGNAATHIEQNWEIGDTIKAGGYIVMTNKIVSWTEEMGFGDPITHSRTETRRELVITRGSQCGLDEDDSYDQDDIRRILAARKAEKEKLEKSGNKPKAAASKASLNDF